MNINTRLKIARRSKTKLSQSDVAEQLGLNSVSVDALESGVRRARADEVRTLAEMYGVSVRWLLTGEAQDGDPDMEGLDFAPAFNTIAERHHAAMVEKGFWDNGGNDFATTCMLWVTEIAELFEDVRSGKTHSDKIPEFTVEEEESADLILRIMDQAAGRGWRVAEALLAKIEYNATRPYKHGKQF